MDRLFTLVGTPFGDVETSISFSLSVVAGIVGLWAELDEDSWDLIDHSAHLGEQSAGARLTLELLSRRHCWRPMVARTAPGSVSGGPDSRPPELMGIKYMTWGAWDLGVSVWNPPGKLKT